MSFGEIGVEGDRLFEAGEGFLETVHRHKHDAQVDVGVRIVGLDGDGPADQVHGLFVFAAGLGDGAEQAQRDRQSSTVFGSKETLKYQLGAYVLNI